MGGEREKESLFAMLSEKAFSSWMGGETAKKKLFSLFSDQLRKGRESVQPKEERGKTHTSPQKKGS